MEEPKFNSEQEYFFKKYQEATDKYLESLHVYDKAIKDCYPVYDGHDKITNIKAVTIEEIKNIEKLREEKEENGRKLQEAKKEWLRSIGRF